MTAPASESNPPLNLIIEGLIVTIGLMMFGFFLITGQPFGLAIGALVAFVVVATLMFIIVGRDQIGALSYETTLPESPTQSAHTDTAKLPPKGAPTCSNCNSAIAPTNKFCPECGHKLTADFAPPSP